MGVFIFKELFYQRHSHILTILANTVAIFLLLCVQTFSDFLLEQLQQQLNELAVNVECIQIFDDQVQDDFVNLFFSENEIDNYCHYYSCSYDKYKLVSCDSTLSNFFHLRLERGNFFQEYQVGYNENVVVLGHELYELFSYPQIGEYISINGSQFKVIGVLEKDCSNLFFDCDKIAFFPKDYMFDNCNRQYFFISDKHVDETFMDKYFSSDSYFLLSQKESEEAFSTLMEVSRDILMALSFVSLVVSFIGIINNTLANIKNRRQEIGIKKAVGATSIDIYHQFLLETILLIVISLILAFTALTIVVMILKIAFKLEISLKISSYLPLLFIIITLGLFSGIYPAIQASKVTILSAIRH